MGSTHFLFGSKTPKVGSPIDRWGPLVSFLLIFLFFPPCLISQPCLSSAYEIGQSAAQVTLRGASGASRSSSASSSGEPRLDLVHTGPSSSSSFLPPPSGGHVSSLPQFSSSCAWARQRWPPAPAHPRSGVARSSPSQGRGGARSHCGVRVELARRGMARESSPEQ